MIRQRVDTERQKAQAPDQAVVVIGSAYGRKDETEKQPVCSADYRGATPRQVAKTLLTYRPKARKSKGRGKKWISD